MGILCLHGFTANPSELQWMSGALRSAGRHAVHVPRLAGHGTSPRDLARTRWHDWLASAYDGYHLLRGAGCKQIVVVGHSMGGQLALLMAADKPHDMISAVVMASPIALTNWRAGAARWVHPMLPFPLQRDTSLLEVLVRAEQQRRGDPVLGRVRYTQWATRAVAELHALTAHVRARLAQVTLPLLLIYARHDTTAPPSQGEQIRTSVATQEAELRIVERGGHIIPQDVERETAFTWINEWVAAQAASRSGE